MNRTRFVSKRGEPNRSNSVRGGSPHPPRGWQRKRGGYGDPPRTAYLAAQTGEHLDRGVVAMRRADGSVYVGWRLLDSDPKDTAFHVYRLPSGKAERLTAEPVRASTNAIDARAPKGGAVRYAVAPVVGGVEGKRSAEAAVRSAEDGAPYIRIQLQGDYDFQKVAVGDLDGDGRYDYVIKQPNFNTDPYQKPGYWKKSREPYQLEAYSADGAFLWRHDMGWSVEEGIWYSPYVVYDLDGDGAAEVYCKGGEGDPRDPDGRVTSGPEWLFQLDAATGKVKRRLPWPDRGGGLGDYNYYCRNMLAVAYLDGVRPHLIVQRGTYRAIKIEAYDPALRLVWKWNSQDEKEKYSSQGSHTLHAADVDGDGRDEIIVGSCVVDDDGKGLWTLGIGHPDTCYVGDMDPARPGLEIFFGIEPRQKSGAVRLVEARTGNTLWANPEPTVHVHAQGMAGDIMADHPGQECYAGEKNGSRYWLYTAGGKRIGKEKIGGLNPWTLWWDADPQKELVYGRKIRDYQGKTHLDLAGIRRHCLAADVLGDWREELIAALPGELRIYTTTIPAKTRRLCLMQDRLYRLDVAVSSMGYNAPPQHAKPYGD
jgi:rhamnogalacturonan endolyase